MAPELEYSIALENSLKSENLQGLTKDFAEIGIDAFLKDGLLKDIPILGSVIGLAKAGNDVRNFLFAKKVASFLYQLREIPTEQRISMISKIEEDEKFKVKIGEKLLYIIEKCEDHEKVTLVAKMFCAFLRKEIGYSDFLKASKVIDSAFAGDLDIFIKLDQTYMSLEESGEWVIWGLFEISAKRQKIELTKEVTYGDDAEYQLHGEALEAKLSDIGKIIRKTLRT